MGHTKCGRGAGHAGMGHGMRWGGGHPTHWRAAPVSPGRIAMISVLAAWTLAWKGASLWHAAKDGSKPWFVALLLSNTVGVLDAIYIFRLSATRRRAVEEAEERDIEYELPQVGRPR